MAQVSRRIVNKKVEERILALFIASIVKCSSDKLALQLIEDLFTPTEKIVFAKRFSVSFMLLEGYDYKTIGRTLKVSNSTIGHVALWLKTKGDGLRQVICIIKKDENLQSIWQDLKESIVDILTSSKRVHRKNMESSSSQYNRKDPRKAF